MHYVPEEVERAELVVETSPVWELILGISGFTYKQLRHTFELDQVWSDAKITPSLLTDLQTIQQTNVWHGLIMLQDKLSANAVQQFSNDMKELSNQSFYEVMLPYKSRKEETLRMQAVDSLAARENYASCFSNHDFLEGYVEALCQYSRVELMDLFESVLFGWEELVVTEPEWSEWLQLLKQEQDQHKQLVEANLEESIERITGVRYLPEPGVWTIKLIPHVSYRPWILEKRSAETKLFFYPLSEDYFREKGKPSSELVRGHKALGDDVRLQLLYQLYVGPASLAELSERFKMSKTTLHHQLSLLKAAKFVKADKGVYSANPTKIDLFSEKLEQFLGEVK
ncbi:winged helix-turn-helix domain-containing protein [Bacillus sp. JCM 19041]|uniref:ArsR/SmtB family transcription factor n=1 Tax=Bacillus sp. JCM 19041 TaxID=1460637 RepID=UPI0006CF7E92